MTDGEITITIPPEEQEEEKKEAADVEQGGGAKAKAAAAAAAAAAATKVVTVGADGWAYFPPGFEGDVTSANGASLVAFERIFAKADADPVFLHGRTQDSPLLPTAPEVFRLRKLLPQTGDYDFNVHVMDFSPGEFLEVKEVHYNQHGMIILQVCFLFCFGFFVPFFFKASTRARAPPRSFFLVPYRPCLSLLFAPSRSPSKTNDGTRNKQTNQNRARVSTAWATAGSPCRRATSSGWRPLCRSGTRRWARQARGTCFTRTSGWTRSCRLERRRRVELF